ncbi:MAG: preprotein translocase subunit YajC [Sphaerochaetaceae bacterium]|jgi:preprotein translocase subunit YajC|nr:preprotein translocase subunit YajC [Sphaerochaetaceae bacterium]
MYSTILAMGTTGAATADSTATSGSLLGTLIPFALIIAVFYFLIIRPQKKRDKEAKDMLSAVKKGDKIVTIGGIHGTVARVNDTTIIVKVDENTRIEFSKNAISAIVNAKKAEAPAEEAKDEKKKGFFQKQKKEDVPEAEATVVEPAAAEESKAEEESK